MVIDVYVMAHQAMTSYHWVTCMYFYFILHMLLLYLLSCIYDRQDNVLVVKQRLTLGYNRPDEGFTPDAACGQITVSFAFRPVASVARSGVIMNFFL